MRFDEIEFESVPFDISSSTEPASDTDAPRLKRLAALIIDLSLFAALALALSPLLPASRIGMTLHLQRLQTSNSRAVALPFVQLDRCRRCGRAVFAATL